MSPKWNYILGATTITVIIGGTVYAIIRAKKESKVIEEAITLSEAREIVAEHNKDVKVEEVKEVVETKPAYSEEPRTIQAVKASEYVEEEYTEDEEDDLDLEDLSDDLDTPIHSRFYNVDENTPGPTIEPLVDFYFEEEGIDPKEDKTLRYDPNSVEAKHQYIRMELADWHHDDDVYRTLLQLFEFAFVPTSDGDETLRTQIIEYKVQFFGFNSRWNREVSFADVILHYARKAEFNCGEGIAYWAEYFLSFNEFYWDNTSKQNDTLILRHNSHTYFNEERQTFGLFGLSREGMDQAIRTANMNLDRSVTYEIEFNEFLKSCL